MKNQALTVQEEIIFTTKEMALLLNCSAEKIHELQYECGLHYLLFYLPCDRRARDILERSKTFWGWFKLQWLIHDQALLDDAEFFMYSITERRSFYRCLHEPQALAREVKPNDVVLSELRTKFLKPLKQRA